MSPCQVSPLRRPHQDSTGAALSGQIPRPPWRAGETKAWSLSASPGAMARVSRRAGTSPGEHLLSRFRFCNPLCSGHSQLKLAKDGDGPWDTAGGCGPGGLRLGPHDRREPRRTLGFPSKEPVRAAERAALAAEAGTYPGAVVCSPAHLAGWGQLRGPGAAALETGKPKRSCWGPL